MGGGRYHANNSHKPLGLSTIGDFAVSRPFEKTTKELRRGNGTPPDSTTSNTPIKGNIHFQCSTKMMQVEHIIALTNILGANSFLRVTSGFKRRRRRTYLNEKKGSFIVKSSGLTVKLSTHIQLEG